MDVAVVITMTLRPRPRQGPGWGCTEGVAGLDSRGSPR